MNSFFRITIHSEEVVHSCSINKLQLLTLKKLFFRTYLGDCLCTLSNKLISRLLPKHFMEEKNRFQILPDNFAMRPRDLHNIYGSIAKLAGEL